MQSISSMSHNTVHFTDNVEQIILYRKELLYYIKYI